MIKDVSNTMFSGYGPLASFSSKIDMAYSFGLITKSEAEDLHIIRKIRNECAHSIDTVIDFSKSPVVDHIARLKTSGTALQGGKFNKRNDYLSSLMVLTGFMLGSIKKHRGIRNKREFILSLANKMKKTDQPNQPVKGS